MNAVTILDANGDEIASVYNEDVDRLTDEQRATGCLIALAPRLLAFVESYAEPATDLVAKLTELDAEADAILKKVGER